MGIWHSSDIRSPDLVKALLNLLGLSVVLAVKWILGQLLGSSF